jgi:hypothetical protein
MINILSKNQNIKKKKLVQHREVVNQKSNWKILVYLKQLHKNI